MDKPMDCIFCKIAEKEAPAKIEYENDAVVAFPSIEPVSDVHIIIIPRDHIFSFTDLEEYHKEVLMEMAKAAQKLIVEKKIAGGYKLVFNGGRYQSVKHIHWHLLGGKLKDEDSALNRT
jgi:histidine triad (HIT) family protein